MSCVLFWCDNSYNRYLPASHLPRSNFLSPIKLRIQVDISHSKSLQFFNKYFCIFMNFICLLKTEVYADFAASILFTSLSCYKMILSIIGKRPKTNLVFWFSPSCNFSIQFLFLPVFRSWGMVPTQCQIKSLVFLFYLQKLALPLLFVWDVNRRWHGCRGNALTYMSTCVIF